MPTYYIDAVSGSDSAPGDGSSAHPWLTLGKFFTACANGDTCKVRDGTYAAYSASAKNSLVIEADTGAAPIFKTTTTYAAGGWALTGGQTVTYETAYTFYNCLAVWNGNTKLTSRASIILVEANTNSWYWDDANNLLYVNVGGVPGDIEVQGDNDYVLALSGSGCTVRGITFKWCIQPVRLGRFGAYGRRLHAA